MTTLSFTDGAARQFDMSRLSKSKAEVDLAPNTIRSYGKLGLRIYRVGKAAFFSKRELEAFIRSQSEGRAA